MGNWLNKEPPPPMVLVPPLFDFPPLAARTRMLVPAYDLLFGKLALRCLFKDYFEEAMQFTMKLMLKPIDDPHVDLITTVSSPLDKSGEKIEGNALFRWQRDLNDPHNFMDFFVSTHEPILRVRSCAFYPKYGMGAFGTLPMIISDRKDSDGYGMVGLRYGSENLSIGTTLMPFPSPVVFPRSAWAVGRLGALTAGAKYLPPFGSKTDVDFINLDNWNLAIGYGLGSSSPLSPSFNVCLELAKKSQLIASFYQHVVVQRRVKNPFEENQIVGITNYIDFGFELKTRLKGDQSSNGVDNASFQVAASWQANKNFLLKAKLAPSNSSVALSFKSWWKPSFTFSISAVRERMHGTMSYGFGLCVEDLREARYERADPNYIMLAQTKEHLAEGVLRDFNKRPMFESNIAAGNFDGLPKELKPYHKLL
ncbi:hypothetical protein QJS10_CPA03g00401 [Acorus calamus]|uniref:Uncharacterized protein n=1 Tax=Acorus calamus TaxID=4465 RepID=A0AAV9F9K9_ACOCL|nr:hypothetical protein QJS10_CPA03g00401 [Acorus calamus]